MGGDRNIKRIKAADPRMIEPICTPQAGLVASIACYGANHDADDVRLDPSRSRGIECANDGAQRLSWRIHPVQWYDIRAIRGNNFRAWPRRGAKGAKAGTLLTAD